jgi:cytochrome b561
MSAEPLNPSAGAPSAGAGSRYGTVARVLHWLLAALIVGSFCVGLYMAGLPFSPLRLRLFNWHKWAGITILTLSALRLLWRLTHPPPPLGARIVAAMPGWQLSAYRGTHLLLYLLFFVVPLLGWAYSSALGVPIVLFGVLPLPDFVPVDKEFAEQVLKPMHQASAFTLAAVVVVHVGAALKHRFVDHDDLLRRMWG